MQLVKEAFSDGQWPLGQLVFVLEMVSFNACHCSKGKSSCKSFHSFHTFLSLIQPLMQLHGHRPMLRLAVQAKPSIWWPLASTCAWVWHACNACEAISHGRWLVATYFTPIKALLSVSRLIGGICLGLLDIQMVSLHANKSFTVGKQLHWRDCAGFVEQTQTQVKPMVFVLNTNTFVYIQQPLKMRALPSVSSFIGGIVRG